MKKKRYKTPKIIFQELHLTLLYDVSGDDKGGEGWGGDYAKSVWMDFEELDDTDNHIYYNKYQGL